MGMFDWIKYKTNCPRCGTEITEFQSKDADSMMDHLLPCRVDHFYINCRECGAWVTGNITEEARAVKTTAIDSAYRNRDFEW